MEQFFAPCPRGLEAALADELVRIGATDLVATDGGVAFAGPLALAMRANLESRLASRDPVARGRRTVPRRARPVRPREGDRLEAAVRRHAHAARRRRGHALAAAEPRVRDAARQGRGVRPLSRRRRRCARRSTSASPTCASTPTSPSATRRSTSTRRASRCSSAAIAATPTRRRCAKTSRRDCSRLPDGHPDTPLLDPMCGSGTIVAEAALIAADRAPGLSRTFGFQKLAWFDGPVVAAHEAVGARPDQGRAARHQRSSRATSHKAPWRRRWPICARRRWTRSSASSRRTFSSAPRPPPAASCSPIRRTAIRLTDQEQLAKHYPMWGDVLKQRFAGWTAYFFTGDLRLPKLIHLKVARKTPLFNGAIECRLFEFPMVAGRPV